MVDGGERLYPGGRKYRCPANLTASLTKLGTRPVIGAGLCGLHRGAMARESLRQHRIKRAIVGSPAMNSIEHDPEKACPGLDPGWVSVFRKDHAQTRS
jgi:hypothetical protein